MHVRAALATDRMRPHSEAIDVLRYATDKDATQLTAADLITDAPEAGAAR